MKIDQYAKAITGAVVAAAAVWQTASQNGSPAGPGITSGEWISIAVAAIIGGTAVWAVPNSVPSLQATPRFGRHRSVEGDSP